MGLFKGQFANVVEWEEYRDDIIFWKWTNREIKKGSKLIIRAGQDAIFMYNGKIASWPARIISLLPFLISLLVHFQKIISSLYSSHSTTLANCPLNNPMFPLLIYVLLISL